MNSKINMEKKIWLPGKGKC